MLHTDQQYQRSLDILHRTRQKLDEQKNELRRRGLKPDAVKRVLGPTRAFLQQIENDVTWYERAKNQDIALDENLESIGRILVALRLSKGMTQVTLAQKLGITQGQVSEDEKDEYAGVSVERARKILAVLGFEGHVHFAPIPRRKAA